MTRAFRINEDDLTELERGLPILMQALTPQLDTRLRAQLRRLQRIVMDVRWDYGPPDEVIVVPADGDDQE